MASGDDAKTGAPEFHIDRLFGWHAHLRSYMTLYQTLPRCGRFLQVLPENGGTSLDRISLHPDDRMQVSAGFVHTCCARRPAARSPARRTAPPPGSEPAADPAPRSRSCAGSPPVQKHRGCVLVHVQGPTIWLAPKTWSAACMHMHARQHQSQRCSGFCSSVRSAMVTSGSSTAVCPM